MQLIINNLHVSYGAIKALRGVSLTVGEGEIVTLIGSNGAGKTTLTRAISGVVPKVAGEIFYQGERITDRSPHEIVERGIVQVPEGRLIFENLSVKENLELGAYTHRGGENLKNDWDEIFFLFPRLAERIKQPAGTLSGGEQQMLAVGRALMARPKLLLLDEPSLGLAPNLVQQIFKSLVEVHKKGVAILLIEQDAFLALKVAFRGYVMETGEVRLEGKSADLLANPEVKRAYLGI